MMRDTETTAAMPTLRDDFTRIADRAQAATRALALVTRDIDRLLHGAKPEPKNPDEDVLKDIGPQSISDCLSIFVRELGNIDVLTDRLAGIRDDLAPSTIDKVSFDRQVRDRFAEKMGERGFGTREHPPMAEEPRRPDGGRYG